jgi:ABC-2 type transport system ATP-binding protein
MLSIRNVVKQYANQKAVDDISFSIEKGQIFGLLGPNGAGKTTLIRMITGIFHPDQGEIIFDGKRFEPLRDTAYIGYMPEERGLYKKMKVGEQVLYLAQLKGLSKTDAIEKSNFWFKRLQMESWWNNKVEDLSKGMSQKLQFVTTVLHEPKLIILDEPFSGLDPVNANIIKEEIYQLAQNGSTVIFSTHRMEQVEEICDHIVLVNKGQKILDGSVDGVKQQFKENKFSLKLASLPSLLQGEGFEVVHQKATTLTIQLKEGYTSNAILWYFLQENVTIEAFHEILPSLNDIFIRMVENTKAATRVFQQVQ